MTRLLITPSVLIKETYKLDHTIEQAFSPQMIPHLLKLIKKLKYFVERAEATMNKGKMADST